MSTGCGDLQLQPGAANSGRQQRRPCDQAGLGHTNPWRQTVCMAGGHGSIYEPMVRGSIRLLSYRARTECIICSGKLTTFCVIWSPHSDLCSWSSLRCTRAALFLGGVLSSWEPCFSWCSWGCSTWRGSSHSTLQPGPWQCFGNAIALAYLVLVSIVLQDPAAVGVIFPVLALGWASWMNREGENSKPPRLNPSGNGQGKDFKE